MEINEYGNTSRQKTLAHRGCYRRRVPPTAKDDTPNQDAVDYRLVEIGGQQVVVVAVADGAGSAPRSDEGSQIAVKTAVASIVGGINKRPVAASSKHLATSLVRNAVKRAKNAVARYGREQGVSARELACTLIVAVSSERLTTAAQVGDGAVVAFNIGSGDRQHPVRRPHRRVRQRNHLQSRRAHRPHLVASVGPRRRRRLRWPGPYYRRAAKPGPQDCRNGSRSWDFGTRCLTTCPRPTNRKAVPGRLHAFISGERVQSRTTDDVTIAIAVRSSPTS